MKIGEPPSEPLLARRATTARSSISSGAGEPDPLVGGTVRNCCCGVTVLTPRSEDPVARVVNARTGLLTWRHCSVVKKLLRGTRQQLAESLTSDRFAAPTPPPNPESLAGARLGR